MIKKPTKEIKTEESYYKYHYGKWLKQEPEKEYIDKHKRKKNSPYLRGYFVF